MKKCAYCGRENGDDATSCRECGTPEFVATSPASAQSVAEEASQECGATTAIKECVAEATTSLSERWRPKTAWLCLLFLVAALIPLGFFYLAMVDKHSDQRGFYTDNQLGILGILIGIVTFTVTTSFSGVRTVRQFKESFAFLRVSRERIAVAAAAGVLIQVVTIYVFAGGLSHLQRRTSFNLLLLAALLAPFFEEPFFRGLVYRAFRNRYSISVSSALVVGIALLLHADRSFRSLHGLISIGGVNVAACILRERTGSLWPSIVCHLAYNAIAAVTI